MDERLEDLCKTLESRGGEIAAGLVKALGPRGEGVECRAAPAQAKAPGQTPGDVPAGGWLITHHVEATNSASAGGSIGWFLPESLPAALSEAPFDEGWLSALAESLGALLAVDGCPVRGSQAKPSQDLWGDFLAGDLPPALTWQKFTLTAPGGKEAVAYLAWPTASVANNRSGGDSADAAGESSRLPAGGLKSHAPNVRRVLRTRVPLIVTLAQKKESAAKVLQFGPGSIIEFDQNCEEPLQITVNNLPIGTGKAVRIGDHFGLRVLSISSVSERAASLGGKRTG
jgi:flagellar motor switch protein FliN/FliY